MYVCMHAYMYVCMYVCIFLKKSNDNFYHIKHNTGLHVTSVTCSPHAHFPKNTNIQNIYSYNGQATLLEIFCLSARHYATITLNMTTEVGLLILVAEIAIVRI